MMERKKENILRSAAKARSREAKGTTGRGAAKKKRRRRKTKEKNMIITVKRKKRVSLRKRAIFSLLHRIQLCVLDLEAYFKGDIVIME